MIGRMTSNAMMESARYLLTIVAAVQALATIVIDLNRTHAAHPRWPGHARFHVIWQTWNTALLAIVECWLVWRTGPHSEARFYLSAALTAIPCLGFVIAQVTGRRYAATLSDPDGIPPLRLHISGRIVRADGNALCVYAALVFIPLIALLFHHGAGVGR